MTRALLAAAFVVAAVLPQAHAARAALPDEDTALATGANCVRPVPIPKLDNVFDAKWSPDGWRLAVVRYVRVPSADLASGYRELELLETLDLRTGKLRYFGEGTRPQWSSSGRYLAYWGFEADYLIVDDGEDSIAFLTPSIPEYRWSGDVLVYVERSTMRAWDGEATTIRKFGLKEIPHYPFDDVYWSADGSRYTLTRYDAEKPEPERFIGLTYGEGLEPLNVAGAFLTEWSPSGAVLLVRYPRRLEIRDGAGEVQATVPIQPGAIHQWGPGGRTLLLRTAQPTLAAGESFEDARVVWPAAAVVKLPDLGGPRGFSPEGRHFSGTIRTGLHEQRLVVYRCLLLATGEPRPDAALGAPLASPEKGRLIRPAQGPISQFMERGHSGVDVAAAFGSPIVASDDGIVRQAGWIPNGGHRVCLGHAAGLETCYFHTAGSLVSVGQRVLRGQAIALVGMSGITRGPHVHWEAKFLGRLTDPLLR